eukprot:1159953-Pelagomonas_calceolata.AAC.4
MELERSQRAEHMPKYAPFLHFNCAHSQPLHLIGTILDLKFSWRYKLPEHMLRLGSRCSLLGIRVGTGTAIGVLQPSLSVPGYGPPMLGAFSKHMPIFAGRFPTSEVVSHTKPSMHDPCSYMYLAIALTQLGDIENACLSYEKAIQLRCAVHA